MNEGQDPDDKEPDHADPGRFHPAGVRHDRRPDTDLDRLAEYRRLFTQPAFLGRERTTDGIRFRFRAEPGIEAWVRNLAAREKACCAFFAFDITTEGEEVLRRRSGSHGPT